MRRVEELLPGITTVTPHARYYSLHAYVATALHAHEDLDQVDTLRRCEVVFAAISILHARRFPDQHRGMSQAHGHDVISASMQNGELNVADLAAPRSYAQASRGFLGPYLASERLLGLVTSGGELVAPGQHVDERALELAFEGLLKLAKMDSVPLDLLEGRQDLCLCGQYASERSWLRTVMFPAQRPGDAATINRRSETALMLYRLIEMYEPENVSIELSRKIIADPRTYTDDQLEKMAIVPAWRGVVLRRWYTWAWRDLWRWLVNEQMTGAVPLVQLQGALSEQLPDQKFSSFRDDLPSGIDGNRLIDAEYQMRIGAMDPGPRNLAWLMIGASRVGQLSEHVAPYFESPERERRNYELTPSWLKDFMDQRNDHLVRDVAFELTGILLARSQRVAMSKSSFVNGRWRVPTRLTLRDGYAFRESNEGGGPVSLRWDQLTQVMSGLGMVRRVSGDAGTSTDRWVLTRNGQK
ncbi:hypothetical protein AC792_01140 [Arthrobacter sp. RIT-PI-e]|nr:hypothetical protein AC792_01140 [Arthrobacter sp. RIT-PI-e]